MKKYVDSFILIFLGFIVFIFLTVGIGKPFNGHHDYNNRLFSGIAENYITYGFFDTKLGQLVSGTPVNPDYYTHHPPLLPIFLTLSMTLFGNSPWQIRLVPILFSVGTILIFYHLLRKFFDRVSSLLGIGFWIASPMFLYFGKMANHEAITLFFIILAIYLYIQTRNGDKKSSMAPVYFVLFLSQWSGWPGYYLGGLLFLISRKYKFLLITLFDFLLFFLLTFLQTGSFLGGGLGEIFFFRMGVGKLSGVVEYYTWNQLIIQESGWLYHLYNPITVIISGLSLLLLPKIKNNNNKTSENLIVSMTIFFLIAIIHVLLFRTGAWRHDYWLYYFLPFISFGPAMASWFVKKYYPKFWSLFATSLSILIILAVIQGQPLFWALQNIVEK